MFRLSLLSVSLLTVMAGAAVAPGLGEIAKAFPDASETILKLILSLPPLFIIPFSLLSGTLSSFVGKKRLLVAGLLVYIIGGAGAAFVDSLLLLLAFRAVLGVGTGIILPLSTGLIADFYQGDERVKMLGFSFAANNLGAIIGNIVVGLLAPVNWHYVFYVYLIAVVVLVLVMQFVRDIPARKRAVADGGSTIPSPVYLWAIVMFFVMLAFYAVITNLSLVIDHRSIGDARFAGMVYGVNTLSMFAGGFSLKIVVKYLKGLLPGCMLLLMALGYCGLAVGGTKAALTLAIVVAGLGTGWAFPFIINNASVHAPPEKNIAVMAVVSSATFLGQFSSPLILEPLRSFLGGDVASVFLALAAGMGLLAMICLAKTLLHEKDGCCD